MKKFKVSGVKKALGDYNNWLKMDPRYRANIMIDLSDGRVWTDVFIDSSTRRQYCNKSIKSLSVYMSIRGVAESPTKELVKKYALEMKNEYAKER